MSSSAVSGFSPQRVRLRLACHSDWPPWPTASAGAQVGIVRATIWFSFTVSGAARVKVVVVPKYCSSSSTGDWDLSL